MPETLTDVKSGDMEFFSCVSRDPTLALAVEQLGFTTMSIGASQHNAVFIFSKPSWTLPQPAGHQRTINIHFEAKDRSVIRVEVGPQPWIASLDRKPGEKALLAPVLARKTQVIQELRARLTGAAVPARLVANTRNLRDPADTASHGVVKFLGCGYGDDPTVPQAARWFAEVIETVTPIVDEVAKRY